MKLKFSVLMLFGSLLIFGGCKSIFFLSETKKLKEWQIDEYKIVYTQKLGYAGPHYYVYEVYKKNKFLFPTSEINKDNCHLIFRERNDYYLIFDLCHASKIVLKSDKVKLKKTAIDSITIRPFTSQNLKPSLDSTKTKKLTKKTDK